MSYKKFRDGVVRLADGAFVPPDTRNVDWREYQSWLANGNTPEPEWSLVESKDRALLRIKAARDAAMEAGFEFEGHVYHSDKDSIRDVQMALNGAQMTTRPVPESIGWKLKVREGTKTHHPLTLAKLGALFEALTENMLTIYGREEARMAQILAAATAEEVDGVRW